MAHNKKRTNRQTLCIQTSSNTKQRLKVNKLNRYTLTGMTSDHRRYEIDVKKQETRIAFCSRAAKALLSKQISIHVIKLTMSNH